MEDYLQNLSVTTNTIAVKLPQPIHQNKAHIKYKKKSKQYWNTQIDIGSDGDMIFVGKTLHSSPCTK